jgi:hypothetical protein
MGLGLLFPILLLAMGVYVLYGAIKGSGRLFTMENFKDESKDQAKKLLRILYFVLAGIMLVMALVNGAQTVLYSNKISYYRVTDAYRDTFPDLIEDGQLTYTTKIDTGSSMGCFGSTGQQVEKTYGPYSVDNEKMGTEEISAFINKAYTVYGTDTEKFPRVSGGLMSCGGSTVDYSKYYEQTDLIKIVDGEDVPVYAKTDAEKAEGHNVYVSSIGSERSDSNSGSFISKLYGALSAKLLTVLNYIFLGLAVVGVIGVFLVTRKFTDKEKLQKARQQQVRPAMPTDAFTFDDEPKEEPKK